MIQFESSITFQVESKIRVFRYFDLIRVFSNLHLSRDHKNTAIYGTFKEIRYFPDATNFVAL